MRLFSEQLAAILEDLVKRLRIVPSQIDGQILGTQVQPAQSGAAGVVDLDQIPSVSGTAGEVAYFTAPDTIASEAQLSLTRGGTGANLSATGAGVVQQASTGGNLSVVATPEGRLLYGAAGGAGVATNAGLFYDEISEELAVQSSGTAIIGIGASGGDFTSNGTSGSGVSTQAINAGGIALIATASGLATQAATFNGSVDIDGALSLDDTGGTNHLLKQATLGGVVTSGTLTDAEHGTRGGGTLHDVATTSVAGFMSATDKTKLDGIGAGASVSSVALAAPSILTVSGSPITTSGTLTLALATQPANRVFAGPTTGADAVPTFRLLDAINDIPPLDAVKIATGTLPVARGGTGANTFTANGVLLGNSTSAVSATTAGAANQVLAVPGGGGAPAFTTLAKANLPAAIAYEDEANTYTALQTMITESANTSAAENVLVLRRRTTGTAASGIGAQITFSAEDDAGVDRTAGIWQARLANVATGAFTGRVQIYASDSGGVREGVRIEGNGSATLLSFYGGTATAKPNVTGSRGGNAALASLLTALSNLGLITDSTTA